MQEFQLLLSEPSPGVLELKLRGEVDIATVDTLREATTAAVATGDYECLVYDLCGTTFMDSSGLHALADANRLVTRSGGVMRVVCASGNLLKVFELTGLTQMLSIFSDRSEALALAA